MRQGGGGGGNGRDGAGRPPPEVNPAALPLSAPGRWPLGGDGVGVANSVSGSVNGSSGDAAAAEVSWEEPRGDSAALASAQSHLAQMAASMSASVKAQFFCAVVRWGVARPGDEGSFGAGERTTGSSALVKRAKTSSLRDCSPVKAISIG